VIRTESMCHIHLLVMSCFLEVRVLFHTDGCVLLVITGGGYSPAAAKPPCGRRIERGNSGGHQGMLLLGPLMQ